MPSRSRPLYQTEEGKRVPSVTTVIGRFKDAGALMHWAWKEGMEGRDYKETRQKAADAGTIAHEMIRCHVFDTPAPLSWKVPLEVVEQARVGFDAYLRWEEGSNVEITMTEQSLVSDTYRYGGTVDAVGRVGGRPAILDWKTSKGRYPEYLLQLAAYRQLVTEAHDTQAECHLLWIDKLTATFGHFSYPKEVMDRAFEAFCHLRELYELDKELKRLV